MKTYARIFNGAVQEIILPAVYSQPDPALEGQVSPALWADWVARVGLEIPIAERFHPEFVAAMVEITGMDPAPVVGWTYDGSTLHPPAEVPVDLPTLAATARVERERLLRATYDPGIMMALRALRMASTPEETSYAEGKVGELDAYAEALLAIPDQPGFPQTIIWPVPPTK